MINQNDSAIERIEGKESLPTKTTKNRGKSRTAAAKDAVAIEPSQFDKTIENVRNDVSNAEVFAQQLTSAAADHIADVLNAVPYELQLKVNRRLQDSDPADFPSLADKLRGSSAAREFFALVAPESAVDGE
jgi:hypothetical protein